VLHVQGRGVERNVETGIALFTAAAETGSVQAQLGLAQLYANGEAGEARPDLARLWLERAAGGGHLEAITRLATLELTETAPPRGLRRGYGLLRTAALRGHPPAQIKLAEIYASGLGAKRDVARARQWLARAAKSGHALSAYELALRLSQRAGIARDEYAAWRRLAAEIRPALTVERAPPDVPAQPTWTERASAAQNEAAQPQGAGRLDTTAAPGDPQPPGRRFPVYAGANEGRS
jgi:TPR repeat protein